jgi:alkaline phosphatase
MRKTVVSLLCVLALASVASATVKNVIVLIPDGCDQAVQTAARWYSGKPLAVDSMNVAMAKTHMANSIVTGSAAAATAFSTGEKTTVRFLSVGADPNLEEKANLTGFSSAIASYAPIETILEAAKKAGKATGLVSTSRITHATPAAYACHIHDRGMDNEIMEHMVYQDLDVAFGGGKRHLMTAEQGGKRTDGEDLLQVLNDRGYAWVETRDELMALNNVEKAWGLFAMSHMDSDIDRWADNPNEPSLAEMTGKALEILSQSENGFFIMIEGSQVDWAGHQNDPVWMVTDFLAFDAAVKVALDFAVTNGDTMVIAFPDHDTGSMSIAHEQGPGAPAYTGTSIETLIDPIKDATVTLDSLMEKVIDAGGTLDALRTNMTDYWGQWWADPNNMSDEQGYELLFIWYTAGNYAGAQYLSSEFTAFGWTTHGHTGEDVPVWTYINGDAVAPQGVIDNTDIARFCADAMGLTLTGSDAWTEHNSDTMDMNDQANPVAVLNDVKYPCGKDERIHPDGTVEQMVGVTVYCPQSGKVFIPKM